MRGRPSVKLLLSRGERPQSDSAEAVIGQRFRADLLVESDRETPVDFISMRLQGREFMRPMVGGSRSTHTQVFFERECRTKAMTLARGEFRFHAEFEIPEGMPPSYTGLEAWIAYRLLVRLAIPWWLDRKKEYRIPVVLPSVTAPPPQPRVFATSVDGPRGTAPFMELALDATALSLGDTLSGSIAIQNLRGKRVREIRLTFIESEKPRLPHAVIHGNRSFVVRLHEGAPEEGTALPFRVQLPALTPTFIGRAFDLATYVEARADVAWDSDVVVRAPIVVTPATTEPRPAERGAAPVGRERRARIWRAIAAGAGLLADPAAERMQGKRGDVVVEIRTEERAADFWLVAELGYPDLGIDLQVRVRDWRDAFDLDRFETGDGVVDTCLSMRAREAAQLRGLDPARLFATVTSFEEVSANDSRARLADRGGAHTTTDLEPFVEDVLRVADAFSSAAERVPPPSTFAGAVPAWRALAERLHGRLQLGAMGIRDGRLGADAVEIRHRWSPLGLVLETVLHVALDPPLASAPTSPDDPAVSPAARDAWKTLLGRSRRVAIEASSITAEIEPRISDPEAALPILELAVALRRALTGAVASGPFR